MSLPTLISSLRNDVAKLDYTGELDKSFQKAYLLWMIDKVSSQLDWPRDKSMRWLGFVAGALHRAMLGPDSESVAGMLSFDCEIFSHVLKHNEGHIHGAIDDCLEGLEVVTSEDNLGKVQELISVSRRTPTALRASFCLGYIQAYLVSRKIITIEAERDRTRPIFHSAYKACGLQVPESASYS